MCGGGGGGGGREYGVKEGEKNPFKTAGTILYRKKFGVTKPVVLDSNYAALAQKGILRMKYRYHIIQKMNKTEET